MDKLSVTSKTDQIPSLPVEPAGSSSKLPTGARAKGLLLWLLSATCFHPNGTSLSGPASLYLKGNNWLDSTKTGAFYDPCVRFQSQHLSCLTR